MVRSIGSKWHIAAPPVAMHVFVWYALVLPCFEIPLRTDMLTGSNFLPSLGDLSTQDSHYRSLFSVPTR